MYTEKTYLYKRERQQKVNEELPMYRKGSKKSSNSQKRSGHKHHYKKIILHYGSSTFVWGKQCEICGRIDATYKASNWSKNDFQVTGDGLYGNWEDICLTEIHRKYPQYTIMTLQNAEWTEWTANKTRKEKL